MTETEWLACADPVPMLKFFHGKDCDRKRRLFLVACCRRAWHLLTDERSRNAVEVVERFAEGLASEEERDAAQRVADDVADAAHRHARSLVTTNENNEEVGQPGFDLASRLASAASCVAMAARPPEYLTWRWCGPHYVTAIAAQHLTWAISGLRGSRDPTTRAAQAAEELLQCHLLRCIFGPLPFRPVTINSAWLLWNDSTVVKLAQAIYEQRHFGDMPILADTLEEAGCVNLDILGHCRSQGEHARGCWVLDLLLGKE